MFGEKVLCRSCSSCCVLSALRGGVGASGGRLTGDAQTAASWEEEQPRFVVAVLPALVGVAPILRGEEGEEATSIEFNSIETDETVRLRLRAVSADAEDDSDGTAATTGAVESVVFVTAAGMVKSSGADQSSTSDSDLL